MQNKTFKLIFTCTFYITFSDMNPDYKEPLHSESKKFEIVDDLRLSSSHKNIALERNILKVLDKFVESCTMTTLLGPKFENASNDDILKATN